MKTIVLPVRLAFEGTKLVIMGTPGSWGDAGWSTVTLPESDVANFMAAWPQAKLPCWERIGK